MKVNKHTSDVVVFGLMSPEKPNARKLVHLFRGFYFYAVFKIQLGCQKWFTQQRMPLAIVPLLGTDIMVD